MPSAKRPSSTPRSRRPSPSFWPGGATCAIFAPEAPDEATLAELFDLAALAPSVGNCQPTRFVRVDDKARRASIRANFEAANLDALSDYTGQRAALYARLKLAGLSDAPIQLAVFCDEATEQGHGLGARTMAETRRYSTVCALHTFWLAARARGLGVGWVSILDPGDDRRGARRSTRLDVHRLSLRRLSARGASHPGTRARRLAGPRGASGSEAVGAALRSRERDHPAARRMQVVDPFDRLRIGFDARQVEVDHHRLLAAAHQTQDKGASSLALISWCGTKGGT